MTDIALERARPDDLAAVLALLREQHLPTDDLDRHLATTLVARQGGRIVGSVAIEVYPDGGLLRSVAVAGGLQGQGVGRALTEAAFALARDAGLRTLYLLTTTAEGYFPKFGFQPIARDDVPASVRTSVEFATACPASAVAMHRPV